MRDLMLKRLRRTAAYRRLFLAEGGKLKPEAEIVLNDLYDFTRFFKSGSIDPQALAVLEGGRQVVRHILKSARATNQELARQLTGDDDE